MAQNTDMATAMDNLAPETDRQARSGRTRLLPLWLRILLVPLALIGAAAAVVHAGSENGIKPLAFTETLESGLNAETRSRLVDAQFRENLATDIKAGREASRPASATLEAAKRVYEVKPLDIGLARTLATGEVAFDDQARAFEIVKRLVELNRRDAIANMWLVQYYGKLGEIAPMLAVFDQTLRTNREIRTTAMPSFVNLLAFPEGRTVIRNLLSNEPVWIPEFWAEFAKNPVALSNAEAFFGQDERYLKSLDEQYREPIFRGLKNAGLYEALFRLADTSGVAVVTAASHIEGFGSARTSDPFGWELTSTGKYVTLVERDGDALSVDAEPGSFGAVAQRLVRNGDSRQLLVKLAEPLEAGGRLEARLICADETRSIIGQAILMEGDLVASGTIDPSSCSFATLTLIAKVDNGRSRVNMRIQSAYLAP